MTATTFKKDIGAHLLALLLFALAALFINWKVTQDGILYAAEDIWWHLIWLKEFIGELNEGIIYPRWLAQSNFLYGSPTFVFYPPFCFYLGALLQKILSLSIMQTSTAISIVSTFACGAIFYLCGRSRWGNGGALGGALIYATSPYIAFDIYFRASIPELTAMAFLPLILLAVDRVGSRCGRGLLVSVFCLTALTHIPSLFMYVLAWVSRLLFCACRPALVATRRKTVFANIFCLSLGFGLAAVFLVPLLLERRYVDIDAVLDQMKWQHTLMGDALFRGYFIVPDLILKSVAAAFILICSIRFLSGYLKGYKNDLHESLYWFLLNITTVFLMSEPSRMIWQWCKPLQYLQFPYRLMTVNSFCTAALFAIALQFLLGARIKKYLRFLLFALLACLFMRQLGADYLTTKYRSGLDNASPYIEDGSNLTGRYQYAQYMMPLIFNGNDGYPGVPEYRPLVHTEAGKLKAPPPPHHGRPPFGLAQGIGQITLLNWSSYRHEFDTDSTAGFVVNVRTFVYPAWHLYIDGAAADLGQAADGTMLVRLPAGKHKVTIKYEDTVALRLGTVISALSLVLFLFLFGKSCLDSIYRFCRPAVRPY